MIDIEKGVTSDMIGARYGENPKSRGVWRGLWLFLLLILAAMNHMGFAPSASCQEDLQANSLDVKSVSIEPAAPVVGDTVSARVEFQDNAPTLQSLYYRWKVNDEVVQESPDPALEHKTRKGDKIEVLVFVGAGREESRAVRGYATVQNAPPTVRKLEESLDEKGQYLATFESADKDGESVNLSLKKGPEGMTIDSGKGQLHWAVPKEAAGSFPVELLAADSSGAQVLFSYTITIRQQ